MSFKKMGYANISKEKYLIIYKVNYRIIFPQFSVNIPRNKRNNLVPLCILIIRTIYI